MAEDESNQQTWPPPPTSLEDVAASSSTVGRTQLEVFEDVLIIRHPAALRMATICGLMLSFAPVIFVCAAIYIHFKTGLPFNPKVMRALGALFWQKIMPPEFLLVCLMPLFWLIFDRVAFRGIYRFGRDGSMITGGSRPKQWDKIAYVRMRVDRSALVPLYALSVAPSDPPPVRPINQRLRRNIGCFEMRFGPSSLDRCAVEREGRIIASFLGVPFLTGKRPRNLDEITP